MKKVANPKKSRKPSKPSTPPPSARISAPFALTTDGQVLMNVADCKEHHLEGRARFEGVLMTREEATLARETIDHAIFDAAAKVGGLIAKNPSPPTPAKPQPSRSVKTRAKRTS
ncbi:MAG TPA: hypothetical protein VK459_14945 [Polyangiaceae bacterium]|nr:hypothetical protein [Polyangiaceae bacterium]